MERITQHYTSVRKLPATRSYAKAASTAWAPAVESWLLRGKYPVCPADESLIAASTAQKLLFLPNGASLAAVLKRRIRLAPPR
jgi:hypothetical protein